MIGWRILSPYGRFGATRSFGRVVLAMCDWCVAPPGADGCGMYFFDSPIQPYWIDRVASAPKVIARVQTYGSVKADPAADGAWRATGLEALEIFTDGSTRISGWPCTGVPIHRVHDLLTKQEAEYAEAALAAASSLDISDLRVLASKF